MNNLIELYCDIFSLYNKIHTVHIRTVKMKDTATLHPLLGTHYERIESMQDSFGEDIIQKELGEDVPSPMECIKSATIKGDMLYDNAEEIVDDLYSDYEYLKEDLRKAAQSEKNLLIQQIIIDHLKTMTDLCADITREMCDEEEEKKDIEEIIKTGSETEKPKVKLGVKPY